MTATETADMKMEVREKTGCWRVMLLLLLGCNYAIVSINHTLPTFQGYTPHYFCQVDNVSATVQGCVEDPNTPAEADEPSCPEGYQFESERGDWTIATEWQLICERRALRPLLATLYFCGVTLGAVICGMLADRYGRRPLVFICLYTQGILSVSLYFASSLEIFMGIRFVQGFFVQGVQGVTFTLVVELFPLKLRTAVGVVLELYWTVGLVYLAAASYFIPNWRTLQLALSVPTAITLLYVCLVPESARWLATHGRYREAQKVWDRILPRKKNKFSIEMESIRKTLISNEFNHIGSPANGNLHSEIVNEKSTDESVANADANSVELSKCAGEKSEPCEREVRKNILQEHCGSNSVKRISNSLRDSENSDKIHLSIETENKEMEKAISTNGGNSPVSVSFRNPATEVQRQSGILQLFRSGVLRKYNLIMVYVWFSVSLSYYGIIFYLPDLSGERHLNFVLGAVLEAVSYIIAYFILSRFGRRRPLTVYLVISGIICIVVGAASVVSEEDASWIGYTRTALALLGKGAVVSGFCTIFLYTSELFPTILRAAAMGHCGFWGRVGSLLAPQLLLLGEYTLPAVPLVIMGVLGMLAGLFVLALPETLGQQLPDTVEESEVMANKKQRA